MQIFEQRTPGAQVGKDNLELTLTFVSLAHISNKNRLLLQRECTEWMRGGWQLSPAAMGTTRREGLFLKDSFLMETNPSRCFSPC